MHQITFKNNSVLPIIVSSWIQTMVGLSEYVDITIPPHTEQIVTSSDGEWILGSLFENREDADQWKNAKLRFDPRIGKFRDDPGFDNIYTWNFIDFRFDLTYENGVIIWSDK